VTRRVLLAALLTTGLLAGACSPDEYVAPPPTQRTEVADPAVAAETVAALQDQIDDPDAVARLGADDDAAQLLAAVSRNATGLRLSDLTFRYITETGRTSGADAWDGLVAVTWRVEGFDEASARAEVPVSFADGGSRIAGIGADDAKLPLWLSGPLVVRRVPGAVVAAAEPAREIDRYTRLARRAVAATRPLLGGRAGIVVEVPADAMAVDRTLGVQPGQYSAIAAVTAPVDGSQAPGSPVHVFVNRTVFDALDPTAAQVVMTHEAVHAVTGAALVQGAPLWLVEGFADYVALRDVDLPVSRTAAQVIKQVKRGGVPAALPADTDFDPTATHLGAVYEAAWQVCVAIVEHGGEGALVALYRKVLGGTDVATALRAGAGWTVADLTAAWRARLAQLASVPE
jgi:hypothetical protein